MSYEAQAKLVQDSDFQGRATAAAVEQANTFKDDGRPAFVSLSERLLRGSWEHASAFVRLDAAGPGIADKVDPEDDGTIDQSLVTDGDLLALTQANYPTIADLYFNEDGTPK